jgi:DNA topoisomerase-1
MNLLVVESPNKIKKLQEILGDGWDIVYTAGHIEDLPEKGIGIDVLKDFTPRFEFRKDHADVIKIIKDKSATASNIYIATDPDREGEAIAHSVSKLLPAGSKPKRATFNAITHEAVNHGINSAREINTNLVSAAHARRAIDRLIGYVLSPLATDALNTGGEKVFYAVGRVQSPTLAIISDRTQNINNFVQQEFFNLRAHYDVFGSVGAASVYLNAQSKSSFKQQSVANAVRSTISGKPHVVKSVSRKRIRVTPPKPLVTSSFQIEAGRRFGMAASHAMGLAQKQFAIGKITYPRTDSPYVSPEGQRMAEDYIKSNWGNLYYQPRTFTSTESFAQEAHECIRPTKEVKLPEWMYGEWADVYGLTSNFFVASYMPDAIIEEVRYQIDAGNGQEFESTGQRLVFDGFYKVMGAPKFKSIPDIPEGTKLHHYNVFTKKEATAPPKRHSEPTIVEEMVNNGIGRPSTYASVIDTLKERRYIEPTTMAVAKDIKSVAQRQRDHKLFDSYDYAQGFDASKMGIELTKYLAQNHPWLTNNSFTAKMESLLDDVAKGKSDYREPIKQTWGKLQETVPELGEFDMANGVNQYMHFDRGI